MEEWGVRSEKQFRLDITDAVTGRRQTILNVGDDLRYHYRPFNCYTFQEAKSIIMAELSDIFPNSSDKWATYDHFLLTGVGSLMQYGISSKYSFVEAEDTTWMDGNNRSTKKSSRSVMKRYDKFTIEANDKYPFEVKFFFYFGAEEDDPTALAAIHLKRKVKSVNNQIRIRIISMETMSEAEIRIREAPQLFDLPLGYGCERKDTPGHEYDPPVALSTLEAGKPTVLEFEVVSHLPLSLKHDLDKWQTHLSLVRVVSGTLELGDKYSREYYMIQIQQHNRSSGNFSGISLRSRRRVWDLGEPNDDPDALERQRRDSRHYELDEITGECTGFGQGQFLDTANLVFPMCLPSKRDSSMEEDCSDQTAAGLVLDQKQLKKLFVDRDGYHLVRYSQDLFAWKSTYVYERRDERFALYNSTGSLVWVGPVSIVRRYNKFQAGLSAAIRETFSPDDFKIRVTISLLNESKDQVIARISLSLLPVRHIDQAQYHRELNRVSNCFSSLDSTTTSIDPNSLSLFMSKPSKKVTGSLDFSVLYPLDDISPENTAILARDGELRESIYGLFIKSVMAISERRLDPLQFYDVEVEIDREVIRVTGTLVELSPLLTFKRLEGQKFSQSSRKWVFTEVKSSESKCAESCRHFRCLKFTYCRSSNLCDILTKDEVDVASNTEKGFIITFEPDNNCDLFEHYYSGSSRSTSLSPLQFFHLFKQKLASRADYSEQADKELDLEIVYELESLDNDEKVMRFVFRPNAVKFKPHSNDDLEDLSPDLSETEQLNSLTPLESSVDRYKESAPVLEYNLLLSNRRFRKNLAKSSADFPIKVANNIDAEQCETICENNNCNSFAYCKIEKTCLISLLHRQEQIEPMTEPEEFCSIISLDYLSKFERSLQVEKPPKQVTKAVNAHSPHDCATYCMEESDFRCRAFYYCQTSETTAQNCFLQKELHVLRRDIAAIASDSPPIDLEINSPVSDCHSYLRKYF